MYLNALLMEIERNKVCVLIPDMTGKTDVHIDKWCTKNSDIAALVFLF